MTSSNHEWLNDTPFSDDIWLSMLVDGELSETQRKAYIVHIADSNAWQKVATAFLDEQSLSTNVAAPESPVSSIVSVSTVHPPPVRRWGQYLTMSACVVCGLLIGQWLQRDASSAAVVEAPSLPVQEDDEVEVAERQFPPSLPGLYRVSDTIDEAVYYADFSLPQFMLDALVLAGHRVTFDQEFLGYTETSDNPAAVPINVIHIQKYGLLLASVE